MPKFSIFISFLVFCWVIKVESTFSNTRVMIHGFWSAHGQGTLKDRHKWTPPLTSFRQPGPSQLTKPSRMESVYSRHYCFVIATAVVKLTDVLVWPPKPHHTLPLLLQLEGRDLEGGATRHGLKACRLPIKSESRLLRIRRHWEYLFGRNSYWRLQACRHESIAAPRTQTSIFSFFKGWWA